MDSEEEALRRIAKEIDFKRKPQSPLSHYQKKGIRQARSLIAGGFQWEETKEGHDFWFYVSRRLMEIGEEREPSFSTDLHFRKALEFIKAFDKF